MSTNDTRNPPDQEQDDHPVSECAPGSSPDPLGPVLDSFIARFRNGERPSPVEYIRRYPALADQIRELLPALVEIEQLGSMGGAAAHAGAGGPPPAVARRPNRAPDATATFDHVSVAAAASGGEGSFSSPQRLGDYRILGCIGEGGMGAVYQAERESLKSRVALKVMHPRFRASASYLKRFHNEARAAAQLHHTNIVPVFDYGEHDGVFYYAMQYIAGHSLHEILADIRLLRSNRGHEGPAPVETGSAASITLQPAPVGAVPDAVATEAMDAPLLRTVTHSLLTGLFAMEPGVPLALQDRPPATDERAELGTGAGAERTRNLGFELGPMPAPARSSPRDEARNSPDSSSSLSSTSLAGRGEDRYHREVARLGAQVADALAYAHKRGVLHRDIKPSNLLLDAVGNIWVTDFGLAKFEEGEDLSQSQDVVGTLRYMAPERLRGVSDRRCDIYALGATLYELLTLRPVFESADRLRLIDQVVHDPPVPPRQSDPRIPRDLETIVLKTLAKDPKDRFATADELAAELRRFLENRPIRSRPISASERIWRWCKRNPAVAALSSLAAALTVFIAIGATAAAWTFRGQRDVVRFEQAWTKTSLSRAERAEHEARLALGQSLVSEGAALERTGQFGHRFDSLDRLGEAAKVLGARPERRQRLPEIRNHAIAALGLTDLRLRSEFDYGVVFGVSVDDDLERYAVVERSGSVVIRRIDDNRELVRLPGPDHHDYWFAHPAFSPDGALLVASYYGIGGGPNLERIWHLGRRGLVASFPGQGQLRFHPDGRRLLFKAQEGGIGIWDLRERRQSGRLPLDFALSDMALDREGRRLAVNSADPKAPRVKIFEFETGRVLADWRAHVGIGILSWSVDGKLLAVGGDAGDIRVFIWNVARGALSSVLQGTAGARFAHEGYLVVADGIRLFDAASGEPLVTVPGGFLGFSPDDRRLAVLSAGKVAVWDVDRAPECKTIHPTILGNRDERRDVHPTGWADFSPDGRLLATCDGEGVRIWEADTGRELARLETSLSDAALFQPDGEGLISSSRWGLYRWPIRHDPERGPDAIRVGPPELLREPSTEWRIAAWLPDHRNLALVEHGVNRVLILDSRHPHPAWSRGTTLNSGENRRMISIAVSPDGRWLAVGGWYEAGVRVWDLKRRRLERILRPSEAVSDTKFWCRFSADGRWLVSSSQPDAGKGSYHFWRTGTWELDRRIEQERNGGGLDPPVFSADGRLFAMGIAPDQVMLADAATGKELARLTTLEPLAPKPLAISPDGTKLAATTDKRTLLIWDLRRIRDQLAPLGLDWDAPPYPTASTLSEAPGPMPPPRRITVIGRVIEPQERRAAEMTEMNRRLAARSDDAEALIHRGWLFSQQKKWPEAIADLDRGVTLRPDDSDALFLLTRACINGNNLPAARASLEKYLTRSADDIEARAAKGEVSVKLGLLPEAVDDFTKVLDADPGRDPVRLARAEVWHRMGRFQKALADVDLLIKHYPEDPALYDLRGQIHDRLGHREEARADMKRVIASPRAGAQHYNNLAWSLATGPAALRDPEQALVLARKAVALTPDQSTFLNTLGVALYRSGHYADAIATLEKSLAASKGESDGFDLLFLAMARHKIGQVAKARADFDRAERWRREHPYFAQPTWSDELDRFRAEAELVLKDAPAELPADVFAPR